jgi:hypothetical protein
LIPPLRQIVDIPTKRASLRRNKFYNNSIGRQPISSLSSLCRPSLSTIFTNPRTLHSWTALNQPRALLLRTLELLPFSPSVSQIVVNHNILSKKIASCRSLLTEPTASSRSSLVFSSHLSSQHGLQPYSYPSQHPGFQQIRHQSQQPHPGYLSQYSQQGVGKVKSTLEAEERSFVRARAEPQTAPPPMLAGPYQQLLRRNLNAPVTSTSFNAINTPGNRPAPSGPSQYLPAHNRPGNYDFQQSAFTGAMMAGRRDTPRFPTQPTIHEDARENNHVEDEHEEGSTTIVAASYKYPALPAEATPNNWLAGFNKVVEDKLQYTQPIKRNHAHAAMIDGIYGVVAPSPCVHCARSVTECRIYHPDLQQNRWHEKNNGRKLGTQCSGCRLKTVIGGCGAK